MADSTWSLVCPFLNDSEDYALGVEFGMLYADMRRKRKLRTYVLRQNQDQVLLALSRLGWVVDKLMNHDDSWFWLEAHRVTGKQSSQEKS